MSKDCSSEVGLVVFVGGMVFDVVDCCLCVQGGGCVGGGGDGPLIPSSCSP